MVVGMQFMLVCKGCLKLVELTTGSRVDLLIELRVDCQLGWDGVMKGTQLGERGLSLVCVGGRTTDIQAAKSVASCQAQSFSQQFRRIKVKLSLLCGSNVQSMTSIVI